MQEDVLPFLHAAAPDRHRAIKNEWNLILESLSFFRQLQWYFSAQYIQIKLQDISEKVGKLTKTYKEKYETRSRPHLLKNRPATIDKCLEALQEIEEMDGDCLVDCDICKTKTKSTIQTCIEKGGNLLVVCLKRFRREIRDGELVWIKNNNPVEFEEYLYVADTNYKLFAVIDHLGNELDKGHYVTNVCIREDWFCFNDDEIKLVSFKQVNSNKAYLLFYQKIE